MPETRRTIVPPKDPNAEVICLLDDISRGQRREPPDVFLSAARTQTTLSNGTEFRFEAVAGMWERVETFVAEERDCCPFFAFEQWEEDGAVVLRITKPEPSEGAGRNLSA
jgi:hypothetical protein